MNILQYLFQEDLRENLDALNAIAILIIDAPILLIGQWDSHRLLSSVMDVVLKLFKV